MHLERFRYADAKSLAIAARELNSISIAGRRRQILGRADRTVCTLPVVMRVVVQCRDERRHVMSIC